MLHLQQSHEIHCNLWVNQVGKQKVGYVHSKNEKRFQLWFVDVVATVKNLQVTPLVFTKNS